MELITISKISKDYGISTRTLRYYEEIGLIQSKRMEDYAYRAYDKETIDKIQKIVILRKLSLSLKQIQDIFLNEDAKYAVEVFSEKIAEIDKEIDWLNSVKSVIQMLSSRLQKTVDLDIAAQIADDSKLLKIIEALEPSVKQLKEKRHMEDIKKVNEAKENVDNVRIIYLPPSTVASSHYIGEEPEENALKALHRFVEERSLPEKKPDFRVYGFNNPNPKGDEEYGYEFWATIPDDMDTGNLQKKHFAGGLYAAYCIKMGDFHKWQSFFEWVQNSAEYDYDRREPMSMGGSMEEHLNAYSFYKEKGSKGFLQLDLLISIKEK
ncbi:MAG: effector binding domain-containing protein [Eubacteriales bacterium]